MTRMPRSNIAFFLVIALCSLGLKLSLQAERSANQGSFLERGEKSYQEKSRFQLGARMSQSVLKDSVTIGRLISNRADPEHWSEDAIHDLSLYIVLKSRQYKVSPFLVLSLINVESRFHPTIVSPRGAVGLMQLMPDTAQELALALGMPYHGPGSLEDPKFNIELGLRYIAFLRSRFPTQTHMLTAYNIGPAALQKKIRNGEALPLAYYWKVMNSMASFQREAKGPLSPPSAKIWL